jgi:hypothetical protein
MATYNTIANGLRLSGSTGCTNDIVNSWLKGLSLTGTTPDMLFTYLRSTGLTGSLSDMLSTYVFGQINFIELEAAVSAYYSLSSDWVAENDFQIELDFATSTTTTFRVALSDSDTGQISCRLNNNFFAESKIGPSLITLSGTTALNDGKLHNVKVKRVGQIATITVDGVVERTVDNASVLGDQVVNEFGRRFTSNFFEGIISNVKLTDLSTPANSLAFTLGELTANYELPINNVFGSEEVTNGDFSGGVTGWTSGSGSTLTASDGVMTVLSPAPDGFGNAYQSFATVSGEVYEVSVGVGDESGSTSLPIGISSTATGSRDILSLDTTISNIVKVGHFVGSGATVFIALGVQGSGASAEFSNITVKQVTNVLTYNNIATTSDVRGTYTLTDTAWLGRDVVVNGNFATDTDWSKGAGVTIEDSSANFLSTSAGISAVNANLKATPHQFSVSILNITSGGFRYNSGSGGYLGATRTATGSYSEILTPTTGGIVSFSCVGTTTGSIDSVSIKRNIDIAAQAPTPTALFNSSGVLTCNGTLACASTIPCGA